MAVFPKAFAAVADKYAGLPGDAAANVQQTKTQGSELGKEKIIYAQLLEVFAE